MKINKKTSAIKRGNFRLSPFCVDIFLLVKVCFDPLLVRVYLANKLNRHIALHTYIRYLYCKRWKWPTLAQQKDRCCKHKWKEKIAAEELDESVVEQ